MELFEPEEGVGDEERADFVAAVIEDVGAPAEVFALAGIGGNQLMESDDAKRAA